MWSVANFDWFCDFITIIRTAVLTAVSNVGVAYNFQAIVIALAFMDNT